MDFWWGYDVVHNYLLTGRFTWYIPSPTHISGGDCARGGGGVSNTYAASRLPWRTHAQRRGGEWDVPTRLKQAASSGTFP
jgi:hypothetical protein